MFQDYELIPFASFCIPLPVFSCHSTLHIVISLPDATDEAAWASWFSPATTLADAQEVLTFHVSRGVSFSLHGPHGPHGPHGLRMMGLGLENCTVHRALRFRRTAGSDVE